MAAVPRIRAPNMGLLRFILHSIWLLPLAFVCIGAQEVETYSWVVREKMHRIKNPPVRCLGPFYTVEERREGLKVGVIGSRPSGLQPITGVVLRNGAALVEVKPGVGEAKTLVLITDPKGERSELQLSGEIVGVAQSVALHLLYLLEDRDRVFPDSGAVHVIEMEQDKWKGRLLTLLPGSPRAVIPDQHDEGLFVLTGTSISHVYQAAGLKVYSSEQFLFVSPSTMVISEGEFVIGECGAVSVVHLRNRTTGIGSGRDIAPTIKYFSK